MLLAVARTHVAPAANLSADLGFPGGNGHGNALTVSELHGALESLGPAPADDLLLLPSNDTHATATILLRDLREVSFRYRAWTNHSRSTTISSNHSLRSIPTLTNQPPYRVPWYLLADSFNRWGGVRAPDSTTVRVAPQPQTHYTGWYWHRLVL